ncbi:SDR family NAD(P)-dependent oxidoreductase [Deinococcus sp. DB0503]|uniref:SDR family NAD(P)-dependent oxidoreductase n=1 Tax=Deinococcus sp. DB0503 TaxID=2479203 RepID=UPI0021040511|nr:SDR family NAD(P)-dependent oxidoreductase [Deinococcus sp. DB0503]
MHTLIVGATGGIGGAAARAFAARGDRLTLSGRDAGRLAALAAELGADAKAADLGYERHAERCWRKRGRSIP